MDEQIKELIDEYISNMKPHEKVAYDIAVNQLESSFDIEKSIGFMEVVKSKKEKHQDKTFFFLFII